ncbi:MAG: hypothetical protein WAQ99_06510 [Pyrinomonadaceae bacterium]
MSNFKSDKNLPPKTAKDELFDAVFGPDEDISENNAAEIMRTHGVSREQLVENLKTHVQERIKKTRDETGVIPEMLVAMLNNIRDYQKEKAPKPVGADEWVAEIFNPTSMPSSHAQPIYNFRSKKAGGLSENDRRILSELEAEIED